MAVAKTRKEKACKNRTKEGLRTRVKTSGRTLFSRNELSRKLMQLSLRFKKTFS